MNPPTAARRLYEVRLQIVSDSSSKNAGIWYESDRAEFTNRAGNSVWAKGLQKSPW
jgi:hypothetical protein